MTNDDANGSVSRRGFLKAGVGAAAVSAGAAATTGTAGAQEGNETSGNGTTTAGNGTTTAGNDTSGGGGGGGGGSETVQLTGENVFDPAELYIAPGTTVTFEWTGDNHNIVVDSQPSDANWGGQQSIKNSGYTTEHTFEVLGDYEYYCSPHQSLGMEAVIHVTEGGVNPNAGGGGPTLPTSAMTMGVATLAAMGSTLALAFFFIKYGGDYEMPE